MNGIVVINKPREFTSFDVCAKLRGIFGTKRIGHSGTLDPMATGVLPVLLGKATKAADILPVREKSYTASFALGIKTNTGDIWGEVTDRAQSDVTEEKFISALSGFIGEISQIPPMYSAVSVNGKRLYALARQGIEVKREPRKVSINELSLLSFDEKEQTGKLFISCSKGTYIRTLIEDIAENLKTLGTMTGLCRNSSNGFDLSQAYSIEDVQAMKDKGELEKALMPVDKAFEVYPEIMLDERLARLYTNGVRLRADQITASKQGLHRVYSADGFLGLANVDNNANEVIQFKNFY